MAHQVKNFSKPETAVEGLLDAAAVARASDVHLEPVTDGYEARFRVDGLLQVGGVFDVVQGRALVIRLMVMAELLTYRVDIPQEGRLAVVLPSLKRAVELRLSVMPTAHGLRAAVRMPAELTQPRNLDALGLPPETLAGLKEFAASDTGMLLLTGPAGSGKTTTIYALLEYIVANHPGLSIISLEDPVERTITGVTQIEVSPFGELTYERVLRSMLRQDPQVLVLGEIRDAATAAIAAQAALSGHRLVSTLHAGSPGTAVVRLLEMGLEPYQVASSLFGIASLRLIRRGDSEHGYAGRVPIAEFAKVDGAMRAAILRRDSAQAIDEQLWSRSDYARLVTVGGELMQQGVTDRAEVIRVLGQSAMNEEV